MLEGQVRLSALDVPDLDSVIAGCRGEDVLSCWVEEDLSDLARVPSELCDWGYIGWLLGVTVEGEALWDLPDEDFSVVGTGRNDAVVERVPVAIVSSVRAV